MTMALRADVTQACRESGIEKPIDLVHLSKLTMGDRKLELEILKMFAVQIPQYVSLIDDASTDDEMQRAAHTIKGAASSIGAFSLADVATQCELNGYMDRKAIEREMASIKEYIADLA